MELSTCTLAHRTTVARFGVPAAERFEDGQITRNKRLFRAQSLISRMLAARSQLMEVE